MKRPLIIFTISIKHLFIILAILLASTQCFAETVQVDSSGWTQDQKNGTEVSCVRVLAKSGITYNDIIINLPNIEIINPSSPVNQILTRQAIETEWQGWQDELAAAALVEQQKFQAMQTELSTHDMKKITLADIDSRIDGISNLAGAKAFLKKLTHYLWAKGYFEDN